jgi:hypothetical protein
VPLTRRPRAACATRCSALYVGERTTTGISRSAARARYVA